MKVLVGVKRVLDYAIKVNNEISLYLTVSLFLYACIYLYPSGFYKFKSTIGMSQSSKDRRRLERLKNEYESLLRNSSIISNKAKRIGKCIFDNSAINWR